MPQPAPRKRSGGTIWQATSDGGSIASCASAYIGMAHGWSSDAATLLANELLGVGPGRRAIVNQVT